MVVATTTAKRLGSVNVGSFERVILKTSEFAGFRRNGAKAFDDFARRNTGKIDRGKFYWGIEWYKTIYTKKDK